VLRSSWPFSIVGILWKGSSLAIYSGASQYSLFGLHCSLVLIFLFPSNWPLHLKMDLCV